MENIFPTAVQYAKHTAHISIFQYMNIYRFASIIHSLLNTGQSGTGKLGLTSKIDMHYF